LITYDNRYGKILAFLWGSKVDGNIHKKGNWINGKNINPSKGNKHESEHMVEYGELEKNDWEEIVNLIKKRNNKINENKIHSRLIFFPAKEVILDLNGLIPIEAIRSYYIDLITFGIDLLAASVIIISVIMAVISFLKILKNPIKDQTMDKESIRLRLARGILLALDFEIGSDIIKTMRIPGIKELLILGVIVTIRIVLSWSLSKEIDRHNKMT